MRPDVGGVGDQVTVAVTYVKSEAAKPADEQREKVSGEDQESDRTEEPAPGAA